MLFSKDSPGINRRKYPRIACRNLIAVNAGERLIFNLINLSENGVQFASSRNFQKKEILNVALNLAEAGIQIPVRSRVVWVRAVPHKTTTVYRVGLTFLEMAWNDLQALHRFILPSLRAA